MQIYYIEWQKQICKIAGPREFYQFSYMASWRDIIAPRPVYCIRHNFRDFGLHVGAEICEGLISTIYNADVFNTII